MSHCFIFYSAKAEKVTALSVLTPELRPSEKAVSNFSKA